MLAAERGFKILRPYGMAYIESLGVYTYAVVSNLNVQNNAWSTSVWVDGDTGEIRDVSVPSGAHVGNTVETWLRALHFADIHDLHDLSHRLLRWLADRYRDAFCDRNLSMVEEAAGAALVQETPGKQCERWPDCPKTC